jgi:Ca-activated chloride channel family protein
MRLPRQIKNSLPLLLLFFAAQKICAQLAPADDFFNGGAQLYISNNIPAALEKTEGGLKLYSNDEKLQKLEKLLKQQQQSQDSQSQQSQSQQQNSNGQQNQQKKQPQQNQQNSQTQQKPDKQKQNPADQKNAEQQKQSKSQKSSAEKPNDEKNQNGESQTAVGQMTPQEAKRLLDAQKGDEQFLQLKPQGKPQGNQQPVKDW